MKTTFMVSILASCSCLLANNPASATLPEKIEQHASDCTCELCQKEPKLFFIANHPTNCTCDDCSDNACSAKEECAYSHKILFTAEHPADCMCDECTAIKEEKGSSSSTLVLVTEYPTDCTDSDCFENKRDDYSADQAPLKNTHPKIAFA